MSAEDEGRVHAEFLKKRVLALEAELSAAQQVGRELREQLLKAVEGLGIYKSIALDRECTILSLAADRDAWKRIALAGAKSKGG